METRPAHETKHLSTLEHPFLSQSFHLKQLADGKCNGTALWLGGQALSLYLAQSLPKAREGADSRRKRVIELGSGVGLTSLALCSLGYDVLATDISEVVDGVLKQNVSSNYASRSSEWGNIQVKVLNWSIPSDQWLWDDALAVTREASQSGPSVDSHTNRGSLQPPFDMIVTADTVYDPQLSSHLLRTIHSLVVSSWPESQPSPPPAYICIERRDSVSVDNTLKEAQDIWDFKVGIILRKKIEKAMKKGGVMWDSDAWHSVEIWKLVLNRRITSSDEPDSPEGRATPGSMCERKNVLVKGK